MEDDWGLQAVVRGCATTATTSSFSTTTCSIDDYSLSSFEPQGYDHFLCFPDLLEARSQSGMAELHDLYKPFFPKSQPLSPQNLPISPLSVLGGLQDQSQPQQQKQQQRQHQKQLQAKQSVGGSAATSHTLSPRSKRRKNQLKRVLMYQQRVYLLTCGLGESMDKNPSKAHLTQGDITDVAPQRVVWPENKWSETDLTRVCSLSPTPASTTTLSPLTGALSPVVPVRSQPPLKPSPTMKLSSPLAHLRSHRRRVSPRQQKRQRAEKR
ncbi:unnamed protein product [Ilex paraguariensis]|uniref:Uncharacterized protein n=1 Tax=Ilex paraguariensis TaxID=185542 RepID=A0ABC8QNV8_9AQUA